MNILVLEDESRVASVLESALREMAQDDGWDLNLRLAPDRDTALAAVEDPAFPIDLAILDLQVPAGPGRPPADREFGLQVFRATQSETKGTKVIVFSGQAGSDGVAHAEILAAQWQSDPLGLGAPEGMIEFFHKEQLDACVDRVRAYASELKSLDEVHVSFGADPVELSVHELRTLRNYARRLGAQRLRVATLPGGRSSSRTVRVQMYQAAVQPFASLVAKIGSLEAVERECSAYDTHVSPRLLPGSFPQYADRVTGGAATTGAVFFRLADEFSLSIWDVLKEDEAAAIDVLDRTRERVAPWHGARMPRRVAIRDIRRVLLPDRRLIEVEPFLAGVPWETAEAISVQAHYCSQHADFHVLNGIVSEAGDVVLIDFARAREAPASLDPVMLELSLAFHPTVSAEIGAWPSPAQMSTWWRLDDYLARCPYPGFVRACREWAHDMAATDDEVAAVAYGIGVRQLRWGDSAERGLALVTGILPLLT